MIEVLSFGAIGVALLVACIFKAHRAANLRIQQEKLATAFLRTQAARKRGMA